MLHYVQTWRALYTDACRNRITCTITCASVFYQQTENGNIANQTHGFTIDYGKFILNTVESPFYKPPRETKIGSKHRRVREIRGGERLLVRVIRRFGKLRVREIGISLNMSQVVHQTGTYAPLMGC